MDSDGKHYDWNVTGPAFVARMVRLSAAINWLPDEHEAEAGMLLRVLYEHVVLFAWLATDPATHLPQWVRYDREYRIKADNNLRDIGRSGLGAEVRTMIEAERDSVEKRWPGIESFAGHADRFWAQRMKEFERCALRDMYVGIYRQYSPLVHGMPESLQRIVGPGAQLNASRVGEISLPAQTNAFTLMPITLALGLLVSAHTLGFPERAKVVQAFES
ncbi:MAG TPA: DUF5677 domain-containing protein [Polyangiaceae bacterium]|nr:DUF5677 domain-containing protein [Polyangiaceae bacterium]